MRTLFVGTVVFVLHWLVFQSQAAEPVPQVAAKLQSAIAPDEPRIETFSAERACRYLDGTALDWKRRHACTSCHTMFPYLMARPALSAFESQSSEVRTFFEEIIRGKRDAMPSYSCKDVNGAVWVGVASAMAINDRYATGKLHPLTRQALDRMWTLQRPDGSWEWPFRDTPPLKIGDHYGVTLAAIAVGMAPGDYAKSPRAVAGLRGIREYLRRTPAVGLHQRAMTLWASAYLDDLLSSPNQTQILSALMSAQRPDGGWSMASLVDNTDDPSFQGSDRVAKAKAHHGYGTKFLTYIGRDTVYKSSLTSDGYATGFAIFVARQAGLAASDGRLQRGIAWLKINQRESGRWFTPSQSWHTQNLISNAGTAYALLALKACGEVQRVRSK